MRTSGCLFVAAATVLSVFADTVQKVSSPDGKIVMSIETGDNICWSVNRNGEEILEKSPLGLRFIDQKPFGKLTVKAVEHKSVNQVWTNRLYKKELIVDNANEMLLRLEDEDKRLLNLRVRSYNEGVAFRYEIPEQAQFLGFQLAKDGEKTEWHFPEGSEFILTKYPHYVSSQEKTFNKEELAGVGNKDYIGMPVIVHVKGQVLALTEANLTNWAGMYFKAINGNSRVLKAYLTQMPWSNACAENLAVISQTNANSPWRVMICADSDLDLLNKNDIILNLNPPPEEGMDFSWVKPGPSSWDWWVDSNNSLSTELTIKLIDMAAELGWKYHTIDGGWYGWSRRPNHGPNVPIVVRKHFDMEKVVKHANEKGIGIFVWLHWEALQDNGVDATFAKLEKWGIKGVKIDFLDRQDQWMVNWYESTIRSAAKHHLLVNYHGAFKPTGMNRTWPNQITREGIFGLEMSKFSNAIDAKHTATLPFTRFLLGPGDFTPCSFGNCHKDRFVPQCKRGHRYGDESDRRTIWAEEIGTRAHAIALAVAYDSPLQTMCDWPERYIGAKGCEAIRDLPTVWRNTWYLSGKPGESYCVAREAYNGKIYIAAIGVDAMNLKVPLEFLGAEGAWKATIYGDGPNAGTDAKDLETKTCEVDKEATLDLQLAREGGAVAILEKISK